MISKNISKKQLIQLGIFIVVTFVIPWLFVPFIKEDMNASILAGYMMILPASGVAIAKTVTKESENRGFHKIYIVCFCILTCLMLVWISGIVKGGYTTTWQEYLTYFFSIFLIPYCCLAESVPSPFHNKNKIMVPLFVYLLIDQSLCLIDLFRAEQGFAMYLQCVIGFVPSFALSCIMYMGEEYGWRRYLQGIFQQRIGKRTGVILLGVIWELWHIPLWFTYFDLAETSVSLWTLILIRFLGTTSVAVFLGWAYMRTQNVWLCALLHGINNFFAEIGDSDSIYIRSIIGPPIFFLFLFSKEYQKERPDTIDEGTIKKTEQSLNI